MNQSSRTVPADGTLHRPPATVTWGSGPGGALPAGTYLAAHSRDAGQLFWHVAVNSGAFSKGSFLFLFSCHWRAPARRRAASARAPPAAVPHIMAVLRRVAAAFLAAPALLAAQTQARPVPSPTRARVLMTSSATAKPAISLDKAKNGLITIAPGEGGAAHTATFVGPIHGLGDTNMGWADAAFQLHMEHLPHVKFVLPNAPQQPVTLNMGLTMPSWYDITTLDDRAGQECEGIEETRSSIESLIAAEVESGIPLDRIVVGGFSQGGAMSLYTGLQYQGRLAGVVCMSGYLPKDHVFSMSEEAKDTPVAQFHGIEDPTVKLEWAKESQRKLLAAGCKECVLKEYPGLGHGASPEELADVAAWVLERLPPQ